MTISNNNFEPKAIESNFKRITGQIYKMLPTREEDGDWETIAIITLEELEGMIQLIPKTYHSSMLLLMSKIKGLKSVEKNYKLYRKIIFDCLNIVSELIMKCH